VPVVATGAIVQGPLNCVMTLADSGITRPRQLQGVTIQRVVHGLTHLADQARHT